MRKAEEDEQIEIQKQKVLGRIEHLSKDELNYLADCLRENSQSFTTYVHSPSASTLGSKGLIYTPGGTHHQDYYPFVVNDFVWQYLLENKEEIIARDEENTRKEEEKKEMLEIGAIEASIKVSPNKALVRTQTTLRLVVSSSTK